MAHGDITFWNRSAEATFGYTEAEVLGRPITMLIAESDRAAYKAALPDPNADDLTFGHIIEVTGFRKDGSRFPCEFSLAALHGREGTAFTAVVRDVIERKQSQDTLQPARGAVAAGAEDGGDRAARRRRRARLQQSADGHPRLRRDAHPEPRAGRRAAQPTRKRS